MHDYLLAMGATEHSKGIYLLHDKTVHFRPDGMIVIEQWKDAEEDDHSGYYVELSRTNFYNGIPDQYVPYFFHINRVVDLGEYLAMCAKGVGINEKRAVYHLREAVRRLEEGGAHG